jgi:hypothetical protein
MRRAPVQVTGSMQLQVQLAASCGLDTACIRKAAALLAPLERACAIVEASRAASEDQLPDNLMELFSAHPDLPPPPLLVPSAPADGPLPHFSLLSSFIATPVAPYNANNTTPLGTFTAAGVVAALQANPSDGGCAWPDASG